MYPSNMPIMSGSSGAGGGADVEVFEQILTTDDIKAVIEAASAGDRFELEPGNHGPVSAGAIVVPANDIKIKDSWGSVVQFTNNACFQLNGVSGCTLNNFTIEALDAGCGHAVQIMSNADENLIDHLQLLGTSGNVSDGVRIQSGAFNTVMRCYIEQCGMGLYSNGGHNTFYNNYLTLNSGGGTAVYIYLDSSADYSIVEMNRVISTESITSDLMVIVSDHNGVVNNVLDGASGSHTIILDISGDYNRILGNVVLRNGSNTSIRVTGDANDLHRNAYDSGSESDTGSLNDWQNREI